ncbi:MAG: glycosyltransferase family 4 protein [Rhodobacter sp.]|nr:glycosyltransferase family 4 protein [Rhodobacter sp.]
MAGKSAPIAYLTGEYPALSHTFILREIAALRAEGREVLTCSIRRTSGAHVAGEDEAREAAQTFYVISEATSPVTLFRALGFGLARPGRLAGALGLAWRTRPPGLRALVWQLFYLLEALVLARHLSDRGARHLHNHFANSSCSVAMLAAGLADIPFSFTLHGPAIFFEPRLWRIDEKIARAKFVACISHFCRSQGMIFADQAHWPKMQIVHCGVTPDRYGRGDQPPGQTLVFVGRLAAVKGVAVLLDAMAALKDRFPEARLTLIGDGGERAALERRARDLGLDQSVTFAGARTQAEVAEALRGADIFVLPSFAEGVPVVLMEAMASTLPVIATRIAGISELVEEGVSGHLVPPGSDTALAEAIAALLEDPDARRRMGAAGRAQVEASFDIAKEAGKIGRLIDAD